MGLFGERGRVAGYGEVEKVEERERWVENRGRRGVGTRGEMGERCKCFACREVGAHPKINEDPKCIIEISAPFPVNLTVLK